MSTDIDECAIKKIQHFGEVYCPEIFTAIVFTRQIYERQILKHEFCTISSTNRL